MGRELTSEEKEIYLQGYLKAKSESVAEILSISEEEAKEILLNGLRDKLFGTK